MLTSILRSLGSDLAIDLGTSNTAIYVKGVGVVLYEPSVVAVERAPNRASRLRAVGERAKEMLGRTPEHVLPLRPVRGGVITQLEDTVEMLRHFMRQVRDTRFVMRPRLIFSVPAGLNAVERRTVREVAEQLGASEVYLVDRAVASALGAGHDIADPSACMVVDVGAGTTDVGVMSCSGVIYSRSTRLGGDKMDEAIIQYVRRAYHLLIGERTAERIKCEIGSAHVLSELRSLAVKGRDLLGDAPKTLEVKSDEICAALAEPVAGIVECVRSALEGISPETCADIAENGIVLAGGGALLTHLDAVLRQSTMLPVQVPEEPLSQVARGAGRLLENRGLLGELAVRL